MANRSAQLAAVAWVSLALLASCGVKSTERMRPEKILALHSATLEELVERLDAQAGAVTSINAETELVPATGSAYSGVIEQYHDVKAFVLAERRPESSGNSRHIRVLGQAPVVRTTIFDMVADEQEFRIHLPTKNKFVVGPTNLERRSEKPIENLRPQHLFEALFPAAPARGPRAQTFLEENEFNGRRYYAVSEIVQAEGGAAWRLARRWWFDRTDLALVRAQSFDAAGRLLADIRYAQWKTADGVSYPHEIELVRPQEDYRLKLVIKKLTLNQPLPAERFRLEPPAGVEVIEVKPEPPAEGPR